MRDIVSEIGTERVNLRSGTVPKLASDTTVHGADIDLSKYDGCMFYFVPILYTDGTYTFTIEESDDDGAGSPASYGTVANADLIAWKATSTTDFTPVRVGNAQPTAYSSAGTFLYWRVGYIGSKKWVRVSVTSASTSTGASYEVVATLGRPKSMPASV